MSFAQSVSFRFTAWIRVGIDAMPHCQYLDLGAYIRTRTSKTTRSKSAGQFPADLQVAAISFTPFTSKIGCVTAADAPPGGVASLVRTPGLPVISTWWPT